MLETLKFSTLSDCFSNPKKKKRFESFKFVRSCDYHFSAKDLKIRWAGGEGKGKKDGKPRSFKIYNVVTSIRELYRTNGCNKLLL